jgi:hypothetical protein
MKTPEEILRDQYFRDNPGAIEYNPTYWHSTNIIAAMKEFGRQAWIKCAFTFDAADDRATESTSYNEWLQDLYLNQMAKDAQERGDYEK